MAPLTSKHLILALPLAIALSGCNTVPYPDQLAEAPQATAPPSVTAETSTDGYVSNLRACLDGAPWGECRPDLLSPDDAKRVARAQAQKSAVNQGAADDCTNRGACEAYAWR
jgi:hypothetical protein